MYLRHHINDLIFSWKGFLVLLLNSCSHVSCVKWKLSGEMIKWIRFRFTDVMVLVRGVSRILWGEKWLEVTGKVRLNLNPEIKKLIFGLNLNPEIKKLIFGLNLNPEIKKLIFGLNLNPEIKKLIFGLNLKSAKILAEIIFWSKMPPEGPWICP